MYSSQFCKLRSPRSRYWQFQCLLRACFLIYRLPFFFFSMCPHITEGAREFSGCLLSETGCHSWRQSLITFQRPPLPNTITLEIRISTYEFGGLQTFSPQHGSYSSFAALTVMIAPFFLKRYTFIPYNGCLLSFCLDTSQFIQPSVDVTANYLLIRGYSLLTIYS